MRILELSVTLTPKAPTVVLYLKAFAADGLALVCVTVSKKIP